VIGRAVRASKAAYALLVGIRCAPILSFAGDIASLQYPDPCGAAAIVCPRPCPAAPDPVPLLNWKPTTLGAGEAALPEHAHACLIGLQRGC